MAIIMLALTVAKSRHFLNASIGKMMLAMQLGEAPGYAPGTQVSEGCLAPSAEGPPLPKHVAVPLLACLLISRALGILRRFCADNS